MSKGKNLLFVIGIDKYLNPVFKSLNNAVYDANRVISVLTERYNFELAAKPLLNELATRENILSELHAVANSANEEDSLLIYFAGHGVIDLNKKGYWVPHDARSHVADYIPNSTIKDIVETAKAKHVFLIIDSCFSGTFLTTTRSSNEELFYDKLVGFKSRWVLASGREEKVSDGKPNEGSPFCTYLIKLLVGSTNKYLSVIEVINYVTKITAANSAQLPIGSHIDNVGHEGGQLVFILKDQFVKDEIKQTTGLPNSDDLVREIDKVETIGNRLSTGKEIVLIESYVDKVDYMLIELFRFDEAGNVRHQFRENTIGFEAKDGPVEWKVIRRFATWSGFDRFLNANSAYTTKKIVILNASTEIEKVEDTEPAIKRRQLLESILKKNHDLMSCLHCGKKISTNDSLLVEIDEIGLNLNVGNVHSECIRPVDRILGISGYKDLENEHLVNFDFNKWVDLVATGQGMITGLKGPNFKEAMLAWSPEHNLNQGNFCIKAILENDEVQFVRKGKDIHRFVEEQIDEEVKQFNTLLVESREDKDPFCYTTIKKTFGPYSILLKHKLSEEDVVEVKKFEKALYSNQLEVAKPLVKNDYAPVCILQKLKSEQVVLLSNLVPIISNPANLQSTLNNWQKASFDIKDFEVKIVESDLEFDQLMGRFFKHGLQPILDPLFDLRAELISGNYIIDSSSLSTMAASQNKEEELRRIDDPKWLRNEHVIVNLPGSKGDPTGILLEDEMENTAGERLVIFRPIQDGRELKDLAYTIPSKYLRKAQ